MLFIERNSCTMILATVTLSLVLVFGSQFQHVDSTPLISKGAVQSPQTVNINTQTKPNPFAEKINRIRSTLLSIFKKKMGELSLVTGRISEFAAQQAGFNNLGLLQPATGLQNKPNLEGLPYLHQSISNTLGGQVPQANQGGQTHQEVSTYQGQHDHPEAWPTIQPQPSGLSTYHQNGGQQHSAWPNTPTQSSNIPTYHQNGGQQPSSWPTTQTHSSNIPMNSQNGGQQSSAWPTTQTQSSNLPTYQKNGGYQPSAWATT